MRVQGFFIFFMFLILSCEDLEQSLKKIENSVSDPSEYEPPPGSDASAFLATTAGTITSDISSATEAMNVGIKEKASANLYAAGLLSLAESEETQSVSEGAAAIIEKIRAAKKAHNPDSYIEDSQSAFTKARTTSLVATNYTSDTVTWDSSVPDEYTIPVLEKMPSRNQGQRGTCAAFAGIGQIEGYILQNTNLSSIDLSEQRFYAMSKPEHWSNGGSANSQGSNSGDGFGTSYYEQTEYGDTTPKSDYNVQNTYNIPLESKCPYASKTADNDIHYPSTKTDAGCKGGVAQVKDFNAWFYNWDSRVDTAQDIYNFIKNKKYPVIVFTRLSDNWEYNDGMITWADANGSGSTSHSSGHAYLVVGMKKLSKTEFPGEGGMCFIIKNSWGKGWGVNGLSCMTLTWFNQHRFTNPFPSVLTVAIDETTLNTQLAEEETKPDNIEEPDDESKTIDENKSSRPRGKVSFFTPAQWPLLEASEYTYGSLLDDEDQFKKILYRIDGEDFYLRGLLKGTQKQTHDVKLVIDASSYLYADLEGKGSVQVGYLDSAAKQVKLCSHEFSERCVFHYLEASNEILVGLTEAEFYRDDSEGPYDWNYLGVAGRGVEVSFPEDYITRIDVRLVNNGKNTNPLRFRIKATEGHILYQGQTIGDVTAGELCSGSYKDVCRIVRTDDKFLVMFKSKKGS